MAAPCPPRIGQSHAVRIGLYRVGSAPSRRASGSALLRSSSLTQRVRGPSPIADRRCSIFDGTGARITGGRWNSPGRPLIYAAETFAGALLEILVHANLNRIPRSHACIEIVMPDDVSIEEATIDTVLGWRNEDQQASRNFG